MGAFSFAHPWLLTGLAFLAIPIIIHFLNRLRFKRVRWAAMEFLLDSQRKNSRRLWWEQLLLLLLRCAVVATMVIVVAHPMTSSQWGHLFGGTSKQHYIIWLDDSCSMNQSVGNRTSFDTGKEFISRFIENQAASATGNSVTILRTSKPSAPLIPRTRVDGGLVKQWNSIKNSEQPTFLAHSPFEAMVDDSTHLTPTSKGDRVFLVSDFQRKDWGHSESLERLKRWIASSDVSIELIDCSQEAPINLGITGVEPTTSTVATNVPFTIRFRIQNDSEIHRSKVVVMPRIDGVNGTATILESIPAHEALTGTFDVLFSTSGLHQVEVRLEEDALASDNVHFLSIDVPESNPVLLVDGSEGRRDSHFLALALAPGGVAVTGLHPEVRSPDQIRPTDFDRFRTVFLLDVPKLEEEVVTALQNYVERGGGLAIFTGPHVDTNWYNKTFFGNDRSLLPAPLAPLKQVDLGATVDQPDFMPDDHPIFHSFKGERSSFLDTIAIDTWTGIDDSKLRKNAKVIARHRDHSPLIVENSLGLGRVIIVLTTAGDEWTSWPQNPSYVVTSLFLNDYLLQPVAPEPPSLVGQTWNLEWNVAHYRPSVNLTSPAIPPDSPITDELESRVNENLCQLAIGPIERPGVYRLDRTRTDSQADSIARAFNVDPREGDLRKPEADLWSMELGPSARYSRAENFVTSDQTPGSGINAGLVMVLAGLLLSEQVVALRLGFHR